MKHFFEQECGRFAFDTRVGSDDNFADGVGFDAVDELSNMELGRRDAIDG